MKGTLQSGTSDKTKWVKTHTLSEDDRKKLIDAKVKRVLNQIEFNKKLVSK